ncbi:TIGR02452 family protein [Phytohabitans sp. ZYX-F-186]|uniref:TIGR02452 family protein n=1 Tax=Phytohabitans maris TaxID=3071409 RepID=A0ABU0ZM91_9ACTN|nr:TIGR02452 family protein [Phytohabitans sp. ZYX-F-186]MDQ7908149.1 TIGR02452 family protein [Phytohabitans sp. ZYX-F-186]
MNNQRLRAVAADTVTITQVGGYRARSGAWVDIRAAVRGAVARTHMYLPGEPLPAGFVRPGGGLVEVSNESTLAAARRLGDGAAALVFASARNPGGGFLTGARAQEEEIARASALHACLRATPAFYLHHRANDDLRYSDRVVYSPGVPVFRDDTLRLLDRPHRTAFLTAAAPNLRAVRDNQPHLADTVPAVLRTRALRVLQVAAAHGHRRLVLGAWGCGVFGNDPATVADAFTAALDRVDTFDHVVFAVLDRAPGTPTYHAFAAAASSLV